MTNPNHTDTSRSGDLVERLRQVTSVLFDDYGDGTHAVEDYALAGKAADLIETQAREIERLREALRGVTPPAHFGESEQSKAWWAKARAALGEKQ